MPEEDVGEVQFALFGVGASLPSLNLRFGHCPPEPPLAFPTELAFLSCRYCRLDLSRSLFINLFGEISLDRSDERVEKLYLLLKVERLILVEFEIIQSLTGNSG